jgi:hypothetical protein
MLRRLPRKLARTGCLPRHIAEDAVRQRRRDRPPQADLQSFVAARADLVALDVMGTTAKLTYRQLIADHLLFTVRRITSSRNGGGMSHAGEPIVS